MRLVDADAALEAIRTMQTYKLFAGDDMILIDKAQVQMELMMLPSAKPERPRGHWVETGDEPYDEWECDVCGFAIDGSGCIDPEEYKDVYKFCPNCGADMRGEEHGWIPVTEIPPRGRDLMLKIHDACNSFFYYHMGFHDGEKFFTYNFFWQKDKDLEIVGWQLCPWEEGEQE